MVTKNNVMMPTRPAPPPPMTGNDEIKRSLTVRASSKSDSKVQNGHYPFISRCRSTSDISLKKPPPRPPPPRILSKTPTESSFQQQRPQNIKIKLPGFKSRRKGNSAKSGVHISSWHASTGENKSHALVGSLIDLKSPVNSPRYNTTNYSSDSSVDSFDSDSGVGPSSGENPNRYSELSGSQFESGFEDDFDQSNTPNGSDPWSEVKRDISSTPPDSKNSLASNVRLNNEHTTSKDVPKSIHFSKSNFKPTIIKPPSSSSSRFSKNISINVNAFIPRKSPPYESPNGSPPIPSIPPPPLPAEVLQTLSNAPPVPPRPFNRSSNELPYCIALYDYTGQHADDLSFKANDKIILKKDVNNEWLEGNLNGKIGIFPKCFVNTKVPLDSDATNELNTVMIALYDFRAETEIDLSLKEGDCIRVVREINGDWLYGECNGKKGQFPRCYAAEYLF